MATSNLQNVKSFNDIGSRQQYYTGSHELANSSMAVFKGKSEKLNPRLPVADNARRWQQNGKDMQFNAQDVPKAPSASREAVKGVVKTLVSRYKNKTKPLSLPSTMGFAGRHTPQNELKEFKNSGVPASQVMR